MSDVAMPADDALAEVTDELYGVVPAEFVSARNDLARRLRAEGRRDLAAAVGKLRRPTPAAWAVNQLCRHHREQVEDLVRRGEQLRAAQARALAGAPAGELRDAGRARRDALVALADSAARFLADSGLAVETHRQEIADTLDAASLDPEAAAAVLSGRLAGALEPPSGFGEADGGLDEAFGLAPAADVEPESPAADARRAAVAARRRADELAATAEASAARAARRRRELEEADAEVARLERALGAARRQAELAAEDADAAQRAAREAEEAAAEAAALEVAEARVREVNGSG
ncbi:MAG TPA: hypothetical protein VHF24_14030 [Acidimicrobiales bacterium]|nr:hypothetical protein [Acidimicrobiales bacterium]